MVAEALACGLPVIATRGTPWEDLPAYRCGWWVSVGPDGLAVALREAAALPPGELQEMGRRCRERVDNKYAWPKMSAQMLEVYLWMLAQGAKPHCVT